MPLPLSTRAALVPTPVSSNGIALLVSCFSALRAGSAAGSGVTGSASSSQRRCYHCQQQQRRQHGLQSSQFSSLFSSSPFPPPSSSFSTSAARPSRHARRHLMRMYFAKDREGKTFYPPRASEATPEYYREIGAVRRPFPKNPDFESQPVLGEGPRELVWQKVVQEGESIKAVAAELNIDMRRVAAVVRLKEIEKQWIAEGKRLAKPYARAVLAMLPTNNYWDAARVVPHEPINEIHMHKYTQQQLFVPVAESRHFTRADAARAFHPTMLSADKRVPIPELVDLERAVLRTTPEAGFAAFRATVDAQAAAQRRRAAAAAADEQARTTRVDTGRFEYRIRNYDAEAVGKHGRAAQVVGWRYGMPSRDNKRGEVKIPTSVG